MSGSIGGTVKSPMTYSDSPSRGNKTRFISPDEVLQNFFYDDGVIRSLNKHGVDVAKGHLALLEASASDDFLQISVLLEGRTIEFLYGPHGLARAMAAKNLIRGLREHQQPAAVQFYIELYSAIVKYHNSASQCDSIALWFCAFTVNDTFSMEVEMAFEKFKQAVSMTSSYQA